METPSPLDRGLSLTIGWTGAEGRLSRSVSLGAFLRVGVALGLCGICYLAGRWQGGLETASARADGLASSPARPPVKPVPSAETGTGASGVAPGHVVGEPADVITPLNVRDPSALVMGPEATAPTQPKAEETPPEAPARVYPRRLKDIKPPSRF